MEEIPKGLNSNAVSISRKRFGTNALVSDGKRFKIINEMLTVFREPMFLLLTATAILYFVSGHYTDSIVMSIALLLIGLISISQASRSRNAMELLKDLSAPKATVFRNQQKILIPVEDLVVGDWIWVNEGESIPADGAIMNSKDFSVNESVITGESVPVSKKSDADAKVYRGCHAISGSALIEITEVGISTKIGKIGQSVATISISRTPLQLQIRRFMMAFVLFGAFAFLIIVISGFIHGDTMWKAIMRALTLSMSILPEEIPVTFTTFLALAALVLSRKNKVIVKQPIHVETLGCTSVIAVDKTGTLTKNEMTLSMVYDIKSHQSYEVSKAAPLPEELLEYAMWSSETDAFDPMEQSIHEVYNKHFNGSKKMGFTQVKEYPLSGTPPVMTHVFQKVSGEHVIALKGSPEKILQMSSLSSDQKLQIHETVKSFAEQGLRVIGVGKGEWSQKDWPESQEAFKVEMIGLLAFQDPPKENILQTITTFYEAGIQVKMITGDYMETALAIANQVGIRKGARVMTGTEVMEMDINELKRMSNQCHVFARMFPEAKMKLIEALKVSGEVVAMTGDGVNDAPALKAAHIGIAMGLRGSDVARESASLILSDDQLHHMANAIALGRQVYDNLKKAIRYIITIHIPIILIVAMPLLLQWKYIDIFTPIHIVFFELLMGPACALVFQNIPPGENIMKRKPRNMKAPLFTKDEMIKSIAKGLLVAIACLTTGYLYQQSGALESSVRGIMFTLLFFSNLMLIFTGSTGDQKKANWRDRFKNKRMLMLSLISIFVYLLIIFIHPLRFVFALNVLSWKDLLICITVAVVSVVVVSKRKKPNNRH